MYYMIILEKFKILVKFVRNIDVSKSLNIRKYFYNEDIGRKLVSECF